MEECVIALLVLDRVKSNRRCTYYFASMYTLELPRKLVGGEDAGMSSPSNNGCQ
jgi:hypothetical protein